MDGYNPRRAPNVSQYVADLNTIPSEHEVPAQQQEPFTFDDDLAIFTNTQFFDFDVGEQIDTAAVKYDATQEERARRANASARRNNNAALDYMNANDFQFEGFDNITNVLVDPDLARPGVRESSFSHSTTSPITVKSSTNITSPHTGDKRRSSSILDSQSPVDDESRQAAEEDKRRRNTAASARFRVKKKQREQALERTAKDMSDKCSQLEARIGQLEMENKWLKNLITEKNETKDDIAELWKKYNTNTAGSRSTAERKDGVGTRKA